MKKQKKERSADSVDHVIRRLRNINLQLNRDFGVSKIGIFGSYARNAQGKDSDIDVLVEFDRPVNLFEFSRLKSYLTDQLGIRVDLVTPGALKPLIKDQILRSTAFI
jgi:uncharacterized protein